MHRSVTIRDARVIVVALLLAGASGCTSTEIPLIEFPKGPPPLPPASASAMPQGTSTSRGEPAH